VEVADGPVERGEGDVVMRVKVSIGWLMLLVLMIALDLGFIPWAIDATNLYRSTLPAALAMSAPPMLNILVVVCVVMIRQLVRRGECGPFLSGFLVSGVGAVVLVTTIVGTFLEPISDAFWPTIAAVQRSLGGTISDTTTIGLMILIFSLVVCIPQVLVALISGLLNRRFGGFKIVTVRGHSQT
jgi:hypothetical protein